MNKVTNHPFISGLVASLIVVSFSLFHHYLLVTPLNWAGVFLWLPIYLSPIGIISTASWLSEKRKEELLDG